MGKKVRLTRRVRVRYWVPLSHGRPAWERQVLRGQKLEVSVVSLPYSGWVAVSFRKRGTIEWIALRPVEEDVLTMKKIKLGEPVAGTSAAHLAPVESNILHQCPSLVSHCCVTRYDDGEARQPGWFTIKTLGSSWVVQVKDPDACASLQAIGATLDDALVLAEMLLSSEQAPWEHDRFLAQQKNPKKK